MPLPLTIKPDSLSIRTLGFPSGEAVTEGD